MSASHSGQAPAVGMALAGGDGSAAANERRSWPSVGSCKSPSAPVESRLSAKNVEEMPVPELKKEVVHLREKLSQAVGQIESLRKEMISLKTRQYGRSPDFADGQGDRQTTNETAETTEIDQHFRNRYWTADEHQRFLQALKMFGHRDVKAVSNYVGTRNQTQIRTHAQKYFKKLQAMGKKLSDLGIPDQPQTSNSSKSRSQDRKQKEHPVTVAESAPIPEDDAALPEAFIPGRQTYEALVTRQLPEPTGYMGIVPATCLAQAQNIPLWSQLEQQHLLLNLMTQRQLLQEQLQVQPLLTDVDVLGLISLQQMHQLSS